MKKVLSIQNLSVAFGMVNPLQVTDSVSFDILAGEFFALVGESGCGKSVTAMSILRLLPQPSAKIVNGQILFAPENESLVKKYGSPVDLASMPLPALQKIRGSEIACIFQEPMQALNPVLTIKKQLLEVFDFFDFSSKYDGYKATKPLDVVRKQLLAAGFAEPDRVLGSFPHELSGGMLQRICIVMALLSKPKLIIADEPTTALDVTVQAQVLEVLKRMASEQGTAVLLITHNMGIVSRYANRVAVMYAGRLVEMGGVGDVINNPLHPYTQGLLAAIPENHESMGTMKPIPGSVPHPRDFVNGCRFADRCSACLASENICQKCKSSEAPPLKDEGDGHFVSCYLRCEARGSRLEAY